MSGQVDLAWRRRRHGWLRRVATDLEFFMSPAWLAEKVWRSRKGESRRVSSPAGDESTHRNRRIPRNEKEGGAGILG